MKSQRTFFNLKIDFTDIDKYFTSKIQCAEIHEAELVIGEGENPEILLKVFFDPKENLDHKIGNLAHLFKGNILSIFKVVEIIQPENLLEIDFSNYNYKGMANSSDFYEQGFQYFTMNLTGIKKIYKSEEANASKFYVNQKAFELIELNYQYNLRLPWTEEDFKWHPINNVKEFITFNKIEFKPSHDFYIENKNTEDSVLIKKEPHFLIKHCSLSENEIQSHVRLICALFSFYSEEKITYSLARIYTEKRLFIDLRHVENEVPKNSHGIFIWEFFQNPLNLITNVNVPFLLKNLEFVEKIIERYIFALKTDGESKFMILYNVLEQVRNDYIVKGYIELDKDGNPSHPKKVIEEYKFIHGTKKTDKSIKEILEKVLEIVDESDKNLFKEEIQYKLKPIKLISMINQFDSLFKFLNLNPIDYELDFKEIKSLRDLIFHGSPINDKVMFLKEVNFYDHLPKFTGVVMLKYFGINDVKKNRKKVLDFIKQKRLPKIWKPFFIR